MNKDHFHEIMDYIKSLPKRYSQFSEALQRFAGQKDLTGFWSNDVDFLVNWLEKVLGDTEGWIPWWAWETNFGEAKEMYAKIDGNKFAVGSSDELWDIMEQVYGWEK